MKSGTAEKTSSLSETKFFVAMHPEEGAEVPSED